jgi:hypothetical protein
MLTTTLARVLRNTYCAICGWWSTCNHAKTGFHG